MTGNMSYLTDFEEIDEGYIAFGGNPKGWKITSRGTIKTGNLDFENVYFERELKFNIFSVSHMCDKKNSVLFKDTECIVLSPNFKLTDESHVLLKVPRKNNMYSVDLKNIVPKGATKDETSGILKSFIIGVENLIDQRVKSDIRPILGRGVTPYEVFLGQKPTLGFMRPFGCPVTILNTIDHLGKFDGSGPNWLFDIDALTKSMNYKPVVVGNQSNSNAGTKACNDAGKMEIVLGKDYILLPLWPADPLFSQSSKSSPDAEFKPSGDDEKKVMKNQEKKVVIQVKRMKMDAKSAFLYGKIEEEVYVCQPPGFEDPERDKVDILLVQLYVDDIIFGSTKKSLCTEFEKMMHKKFQMSSMGELTFFLGLQVKQKKDGIFISQDKYVTEILKKFSFTNVKTASTPMETQKPLLKYKDGKEVDVHLYRSMISSLMYLTSSRPDIMFAVCICARYQVNPKVSHLHAMKRIFRYLKAQLKLDLWYPKDLPFDLVAYTDSDYAGASLDRKSTTGGCQFLGCRLISWQCKKQTVVANSTTEAEYVAASSCCGQVLWIQNQLLDYGYNFMHTKIYIDNESTICIVKNPVFHSKTKHIEIRHHFIRDSNEKKLIQMIKIHTDKNVADLLTKAFDVSRFQYLIASIGMFNL
ncbi:putative ribonuclease H-like domain-containing protein [Tanacetum coccineum]